MTVTGIFSAIIVGLIIGAGLARRPGGHRGRRRGGRSAARGSEGCGLRPDACRWTFACRGQRTGGRPPDPRRPGPRRRRQRLPAQGRLRAMLAEAVRVVAAGDAMLRRRSPGGCWAPSPGSAGPRTVPDRSTGSPNARPSPDPIAPGAPTPRSPRTWSSPSNEDRRTPDPGRASWAFGTGPRGHFAYETGLAPAGRPPGRNSSSAGALPWATANDPARTTPQRGLGQRSPGSPCSTGVMFGPAGSVAWRILGHELDVPGDEVSLADLDRHVRTLSAITWG